MRKILGSIILVLLIAACVKNPEIGAELTNHSGLSLQTISYNRFPTKTVWPDSGATNRRSRVLLGGYFDSIFGYTGAAFATQIRLSSYNVSFGANPQVDSIVLYLTVRGYYGNSAKQQTISVYELTQPLDVSLNYYAEESIADYADTTATPLGQVTTTWNVENDDVVAIRLDSSFGDKLIADSAFYIDDTTFFTVFNGLLVKAGNEDAAIYYLDLLSEDSRVVLYYHNDEENNLSYPFYINEYCAYFSFFKHDYRETPVEKAITTNESRYLYIQSMNGVKAEIDLSPVTALDDSGTIGVNKAILTIPIDKTISDLQHYLPPGRLLLELVDETEGFDAPSDYYIDVTYFDGTYDEEHVCYRFNITQYVQEMLKGSMTHKKLYIFPAETKISAKRVILENTDTLPISLDITYTKY